MILDVIKLEKSFFKKLIIILSLNTIANISFILKTNGKDIKLSLFGKNITAIYYVFCVLLYFINCILLIKLWKDSKKVDDKSSEKFEDPAKIINVYTIQKSFIALFLIYLTGFLICYLYLVEIFGDNLKYYIFTMKLLFIHYNIFYILTVISQYYKINKLKRIK